MSDYEELKAYWLERIAKFTDDYIDEWTSKGNDLSGLHRIQDDLINEIVNTVVEHEQKILEELRHHKTWGATNSGMPIEFIAWYTIQDRLQKLKADKKKVSK